MTGNATVAGLANALADQAPAGSLTRRAAGCVAVAYSTTKTPAPAHRVLAELDEALRAACVALAAQLTNQIQKEGS